jgi:RHS repeat-associated protein
MLAPLASRPALTVGNREDLLKYYRARYYHPDLQRFVSEDPIGFAGGDVNLYAYVFNDPLNNTDPTGEIAPVIAAGVACGAGAIGGAAVVLSGRKPSWGSVAIGAGIGCAGGLAVLGGVALAGAVAVPAAIGATGEAVAAAGATAATALAAGRWSIVPSAAARLDHVAARFGTTADAVVRAAQQSNARFSDLLAKNWGNINVFLPRPDGAAGFIRVTTDPSGSRVISAGLMRSGQVANGVINRRFLPVE